MAKKDVFERNGAQPARQPGPKLGQGALAAQARLGLAELRNATSLAPVPAAEVQREARQPQQTRQPPQQGRSR